MEMQQIVKTLKTKNNHESVEIHTTMEIANNSAILETLEIIEIL